MESKINLLLALFAAILIIGGGFMVVSHGSFGDTSGGSPIIPINGESITNSSVSLTTGTSTQVLVGSGGRLFAYMCNTASATQVFASFGATAAASQGTLIAANSCLKLEGSNLITSVINAYQASGATTTISLSYSQ